jgi:hypothetical protein
VQGSLRLTLFSVSHEKMCQISYKISLFCMATIVARKKSHTLETVGIVNSDIGRCAMLYLAMV